MNTTKQFESCSIPVQLQEQIPEEIQEVEQAVPPVSHPKVTVKPMRNKEPEKKKLDETLLQKYRGRESPLYRTNNSIYGAKPVTEVHKHTKWHGANGSFTKEFVGGMYRDNSLNCTRSRSGVMPDPNFGTNSWFPNQSV